ncbi:MAG: MerR family transcriptional regulator [Candidatus Sericytochromatia bacterium]
MAEHIGTQVAQELGVPAGQVAEWVDEFHIPLPERYQKNAVQVLKLVKDLKDKNCGFRTIQRQIQMDYPELEQQTPDGLDPRNPLGSLRDELMTLGELAEKYAQANYTIGQMSMQMRQLEEDNQRLKSQLKLLPSPEAWQILEDRMSAYRNLAENLQQRLRALEAPAVSATEPLRSLPALPEPDVRQLQLPFDND